MKSFKTIAATLMIALAAITAQAQLPSVQLKDLEGKTVDTAKLSNDGKPFVITFFASWCKPCNRELKAIHEVYPDWQEETGMKVVAISVDTGQNASKVKPTVDAEGWEYDILLDPNSDFMRAMGIQMIPHCLIVGRRRAISPTAVAVTPKARRAISSKRFANCRTNKYHLFISCHNEVDRTTRIAHNRSDGI